MNPVHDLTRALAHRLTTTRSFAHMVPDDAAATRLFLAVADGGGCPRCSGARWAPLGVAHVRCATCGVVSVYAATAFARRRLAPRLLLAAIFVIFVDPVATSARAFSRHHRLRLATAWQLLHDVREALPRAAPQEGALQAAVLGSCRARLRRIVALAGTGTDSLRLAVVEAGSGVPPGPGRRELALWWGRLRLWLADVYRGVSPDHLWRYLAEYAARHGRVERAGALHL